MRDRPFLILGGGGHGRVVLDLLRLLGGDVLGFIDPQVSVMREINGIPCLGGDDFVIRQTPSSFFLALGLGGTGDTTLRSALFERFVALGYVFPPLIHPSAIVATDVKLGEGSQIMAGAVIQTGSLIARNVIVNTRASIDHDCVLEDHVHIAPGAVISGGVVVGRGAHVGTGAVVIQGIEIRDESLVAAGAVVVRDVLSRTKVFGVPAREK